jgi:soluble lytic murein transglycosylase
MKTRHILTMSLGILITMVCFQNWSFRVHGGKKEMTPSISEAKRLQHVRDLVGYKMAFRMGATHPQISNVMDQFIVEKIKSSWGGTKKKMKVRQIANAIIEESNRHGFDPLFLMAVIKRESSFNEEARGGFGEIGLMQIKPDTAEWIAKKSNLAYRGERSLLDPVQNIRIGAAYFAFLRKRLPERGLYVSAYNMGAKNVRELLKQKKTPREYLTSVLSNYEAFYSEVIADILTTPVSVARK